MQNWHVRNPNFSVNFEAKKKALVGIRGDWQRHRPSLYSYFCWKSKTDTFSSRRTIIFGHRIPNFWLSAEKRIVTHRERPRALQDKLRYLIGESTFKNFFHFSFWLPKSSRVFSGPSPRPFSFGLRPKLFFCVVWTAVKCFLWVLFLWYSSIFVRKWFESRDKFLFEFLEVRFHLVSDRFSDFFRS